MTARDFRLTEVSVGLEPHEKGMPLNSALGFLDKALSEIHIDLSCPKVVHATVGDRAAKKENASKFNN